jgi:Predicted ATP-binding protein involved in virulence
LTSKDAEEARTRSRLKDLTYTDPLLAAVRSAITMALGGMYEFPHMEGTPPELYITHKESGQDFKVSQLSDGYKAMLALVMDLARRMAQAKQKISPDGKVPALSYPGIVLIDEIELHLHPAWQQTVLQTLTTIFPNIQFIVTTHSPQVISSIKPEHVRILDNGKITLPSSNTFGAESNAILKEVFGVPPRAPSLATELLDRYVTFITTGKKPFTRGEGIAK